MKVFRELLLFSFLAFACGSLYQVPVKLMDGYLPGGVLTTIPWKTFTSAERTWNEILKPRVSNATEFKLNRFFHQMGVANNKHHQAFESIVSMCASSQTTLNYFLKNFKENKSDRTKRVNDQFKKESIAKNEFLKSMDDFRESKSHLSEFLYNLLSAEEFIDTIDPRKEIAHVNRQKCEEDPSWDGSGGKAKYTKAVCPPPKVTATPGWWGGLKNKLFADSPYDRTIPMDNDAPKMIAFLSGLEDLRGDVMRAAVHVQEAIQTMDTVIKEFKDSQVDHEETATPTLQEVEALLSKCERYDPPLF